MNTNTHNRPAIRRFTLLTATASLLAIAVPSVLHAQAAFTGTDAYTQNFDTLPSHEGSGTTTFTFSNNGTLAGWYASVAASGNGRASAGAEATSGRIYSWGASSGATVGDRALGIHAPAGFDSTAWLGLQLQNTSGATIASVTLTFDVEQWRTNANPTTWAFSYLVTSTSGNQLATAGYTMDTNGNATSIATGSVSGGYKGGKTVSVTLTGLDWSAGDYLWLRWGSDQPANAVGLGLDNLRVEVAQIPEPGVAALLMAFPILTAAWIIRRRSGAAGECPRTR